ncbi:hypothetical protein [Clostridium botulinum]|uniref:hypothetical protein n=1 Tax=Clostridium botulinum TaxID=1491 RepID=UPI003DA51307
MANFLSASALLVPYNTYIYYLNSQMTVNYQKSFISIGKKYPMILVTYNFACPYRNYVQIMVWFTVFYWWS